MLLDATDKYLTEQQDNAGFPAPRCRFCDTVVFASLRLAASFARPDGCATAWGLRTTHWLDLALTVLGWTGNARLVASLQLGCPFVSTPVFSSYARSLVAEGVALRRLVPRLLAVRTFASARRTPLCFYRLV